MRWHSCAKNFIFNICTDLEYRTLYSICYSIFMKQPGNFSRILSGGLTVRGMKTQTSKIQVYQYINACYCNENVIRINHLLHCMTHTSNSIPT